MTYYKSFAIVGFGTLGSLILEEFLKAESTRPGLGYELRVLTRSLKPELTEYALRGVNIIPVDYGSLESLTHALRGVDVVISTLRDDGLVIQRDVVHAAKSTGVKLFVPSEYERDTRGDTSEYLKDKAITHALLKELSLPYTLIFTGLFPETFLNIATYLGIDLKAGKFVSFGNGDVPISWTSPKSIAPFVHHILTTLTASQLENQVFNIEGDRKTWRQVIGVWEKKHGRPAQITVKSDEEIQRFKEVQTYSFFKMLPDALRDGSMLTGGEHNTLWPEWKPLKWEEFMP